MNKREIKAKEYLINSIHIMQQKGYHGTSIKDLTDELGIPKGSFYNYFDSKVDYTKKALRYFADYIIQLTYFSNESETLTSKEKVVKSYERVIGNINSKELKYGCFIGKLSLELGTSDNEIKILVDEIHNGMKNKIVDMLLEDNLIDKNEIEYISNVIVYCWQGSMMRYITSNDIVHLNNFIKLLNNILS